MGQEISQQNTCNIGRRQHQKPNQPKNHHHTQQKLEQQQNLTISKEKYSKLQNTYSSSNTPIIPSKSNKSEQHRKQQHLATPHSYVKSKISKKLSASSSSNTSTASEYQNTSVISNNSTTPKTESLYYEKVSPLNYSALSQHQRKHSQSNDSGIYYSSSGSSCRRSSSSAASICGSTTGSAASTTTSCKSLDKQKNYLNHHLYIKSYLDILEEDEKARANFQPARPGIRNYTPKILSSDTAATTTLSTSVPAQAKQRSKIKDDPWI